MRKVFILVVILSFFVISGCQQHACPSAIKTSSITISNDNYEQESSKVEIKGTKYQGKENYENVSRTFAYLYQNERYYYYSTGTGLFSLDKQTKNKAVIDKNFNGPMDTFKDIIYYDNDKGGVVILDTKTNEIEVKDYSKLFNLKLEASQTRYQIALQKIKDGWIVLIYDSELNTENAYLADADFTKYTKISRDYWDFVLDDEMFFIDEDGNVRCYNYIEEKEYYVTDHINLDSEALHYADGCSRYLGKDRILALSNNDCLEIISLKEGKVCAQMPMFDAYNNCWPSITYNDQYMYFLYNDTLGNYYLYSVSYCDSSIKQIYNMKVESDFSYSIESADEEYIYLSKFGFDDQGNTVVSYYRMKNDGGKEEFVFKAVNVN